MAVIPSTPNKPMEAVSEIKDGNDSENKVQENENKNLGTSGSKRSRTKDPGVRRVGNRIYDSKNGSTCHQCRQKTTDLAVQCKNIRGNNKPCTLKFCQPCLANRYGQKAAVVKELENWTCPKCSGNCNCSFCLKKQGIKPTGILIHSAKAKGYSSVSEMILADGATVLIPENPLKVVGSSPKKKAAQEMVKPKLYSSPSHDEGYAKQQDGAEVDNSQQKKAAQQMVQPKLYSSPSHDEGYAEQQGDAKVDNSPKKKAAQETVESKLSLSPSHDEGPAGEQDDVKVDNSSPKKKAAQEMVESKFSSSPSHDEISREKQDDAVNDVTPDIVLPVGTDLTTVCGIEMQPEDVGKVLQFLEFCTVFGEILEVKKGQPECIVRDLIDGRSSRPGRFSLTTQLHIRLISLIQEDLGQGSPDLSPTRGKDSWVHALKECICGSESGPKLQLLEHLDQGADGYEQLNSSDKLMILNILCDEVLGTTQIRSWIDDQNSEHAEKAKEQKGRIHSAKDKEKHLKQRIQDEVVKAIVERRATLSNSEHEALISQMKLEAAQAHTEMLQSTIMFKKRNRTSEAIRTESFHFDSNGHVYWRLKCMSDSSEMLVQDVGTENTATQEKWFSLDDEQKEVVEKHVNKLRGRRRRRIAKVTPVQP